MFDFYGVLCSEIAPNFFKARFGEEEAATLKDKYFKPADLGEYDFNELIRMMAKDFNLKEEDILNEFKSYVKPNYELFDYLLKLREHNYVALLSNAVIGLFETLLPDLDYDKYFDKHFISAYHKMAKPDLKFYQLCINSFDIKFDNIFMFDDKDYNVNHLYQIGVNGVIYKNNKELFKLLDQYL